MTCGVRRSAAAGLVWLALCGVVQAQSGAAPLYRVFLLDGTALVSYGEWARVDSSVVFSMPVMAGADAGPLHLVTIDSKRVDWHRTDQYANAVRASHYAATRGDQDFARLNAEVAQALNDIALLDRPCGPNSRARAPSAGRLAGLAYGYRAREVHEFVGVLDEVSRLRASAGPARTT